MHGYMMKKTSFLCLLCLLLTASCASEKYLEPSGKAAFVPDESTDFSAYIAQSHANILEALERVQGERPYVGGYSNVQAADMRSPFQVLPAGTAQCDGRAEGSRKGFLLIHGLTDSPYLMRDIAHSLHAAYPCALIRAVLLPGHGTVVGDTLKMQRDDWRKIVHYGVQSFQKNEGVQDLYLIGFSTGTSLTIDYLQAHPSDSRARRADKIRGVVLLSAAVKAKTNYAFLAPLISQFKDWESVYPERDAVRYESFSFNAGAQFYNLTQNMLDPAYRIKVPLLMAVSADDATIDARAARAFYCSATGVQRKALLWYESVDTTVNQEIAQLPELSCENILTVRLESFDKRYMTRNMAHTAITMAPSDPHYGVHGRYHNCKEYDSPEKASEFAQCEADDSQAIFGEDMRLLKQEGALSKRYFRRGTFNPDYDRMVKKIICFADESCPVEQLVK